MAMPPFFQRKVFVWVLAALAQIASPAAGEIYRWTDGAGRQHFTQDLNQVPPRHRDAARKAAAKPSGRDPLQSYSTPPSARASGRARARRGVHEINFERHGTLMMVQVQLNDHVVAPFLADTGASGISIPSAVAQELGIRIDAMTPTVVVGTANGNVVEPLVELDSVQVGGARVEGLHANVSSSMSFGLLGGAFFNNFVYQVDAAAGVITLAPNDSVRGGYTRAQWRERFGRVRAPLAVLEERLESGADRRPGRIAELEAHRRALRGELAKLENSADRALVPHGWRE
jgi:clan AA aspartic protease (TIGR02281 family)